jgi:hypothetical protein
MSKLELSFTNAQKVAIKFNFVRTRALEVISVKKTASQDNKCDFCYLIIEWSYTFVLLVCLPGTERTILYFYRHIQNEGSFIAYPYNYINIFCCFISH